MRKKRFEAIWKTQRKQDLKITNDEQLTLILNARLNPLAKKPPKGPITELNTDMENEWNTKGYMVMVFFKRNCKK